jgi:hypothetical protein
MKQEIARLQSEDHQHRALIEKFIKERKKTQTEIQEYVEEVNRIKKSWKPEEGVYCSCTFEDNPNPALLSECGYHEAIRYALGAAHKALWEIKFHAVRVLNEKCAYAKEGFEHITDMSVKAIDSIAEVVKSTEEPRDQAVHEADCELCKASTRKDGSVKQRFIPAILCRDCAGKDLIVSEDRKVRDSRPQVNWHGEDSGI